MCFSYTTADDESKTMHQYVVTSSIILGYLIVLELLQVKSHGPIDYICDIKNITDLISILGQILFITLYYLRGDYGLEEEVLTVVIFFGVLKGMLTIFELFHYTRFLVYMVVRTVDSLLPFMIFLTGQQIHFGAVFNHTD